jgi:hypothetical protein
MLPFAFAAAARSSERIQARQLSGAEAIIPDVIEEGNCLLFFLESVVSLVSIVSVPTILCRLQPPKKVTVSLVSLVSVFFRNQ